MRDVIQNKSFNFIERLFDCEFPYYKKISPRPIIFACGSDIYKADDQFSEILHVLDNIAGE